MSEAKANVAEFTVSEIAFSVKRTIEDAYGFVRVRGEISGYRGPHSSGHAYFSLKDDKARIEAVVWRGSLQKLRFKPEEGMEVIATGKLTTFPGASKYQIVIEALEPAGVGALMALLEERRRMLAAEGLFDAARKQLLPSLPRVIGVVTSPTGAVIRDILHRLADRFPVHVLVWPVRVQGETSAAEVARAIAGFNALAPDGPIPRPDLLIVARGGGSLEDLWSFNEEIVVRAAAASDIPLVSAVGHETDWTLIDHAADVRAPTPTGAAEMAVPVRTELIGRVDDLARRLPAALRRGLDDRRATLRAAARALPQPADLVASARQRLDLAAARLGHALAMATRVQRGRFERAAGRLSPRGLHRLVAHAGERLESTGARGDRAIDLALERRRERLATVGLAFRRAAAIDHERRATRLDTATKLLASYGYKDVLRRGFALVRDADDRPLHAAAEVAAGAALTIEFTDGRIGAVAVGGGVAPDPAPAPPKPRAQPARAASPRPARRSPTDQGSLF